VGGGAGAAAVEGLADSSPSSLKWCAGAGPGCWAPVFADFADVDDFDDFDDFDDVADLAERAEPRREAALLALARRGGGGGLGFRVSGFGFRV